MAPSPEGAGRIAGVMEGSPRRIVSLNVEPTAGLGNRMRVVAAALELADRLRCPLRLVWTRTGALGCRFDELFEPIAGVQIAEHAWTTSRLERLVGSRSGFYTYLTQTDIERRMRGAAFDDLAHARRPYLITCSRFLPAHGRIAMLRPIGDVARIVDGTAASFTPHTIGVHIRRGEEDPATSGPLTPPVECFLAAMQQRLDAAPQTNFFLACDSRRDEARVMSAFGGRVTTLPKSLDRWTREAIRSALIDLLCLSRTPLILGSFYSSFSEIAAEIGGARLEIVPDPEGEPSAARFRLLHSSSGP